MRMPEVFCLITWNCIHKKKARSRRRETMAIRSVFSTFAGLLVAHCLGAVAQAESPDLRVATQFGIGAMPMIIMQKNKVLERHLAAADLAAVNVTWRQFPGGNPMNEGLLS